FTRELRDAQRRRARGGYGRTLQDARRPPGAAVPAARSVHSRVDGNARRNARVLEGVGPEPDPGDDDVTSERYDGGHGIYDEDTENKYMYLPCLRVGP